MVNNANYNLHASKTISQYTAERSNKGQGKAKGGQAKKNQGLVEDEDVSEFRVSKWPFRPLGKDALFNE